VVSALTTEEAGDYLSGDNLRCHEGNR
jgi:hypothetical protein